MRVRILFVVSLLFSACGVVDFYTVDDPATGYDAIPSYDLQKAQLPYTLSQFQTVLDQSNLQDFDIPLTILCCV